MNPGDRVTGEPSRYYDGRPDAPAVKDMSLYAVRALTEPSCKSAYCNPVDNPACWISVQLSAEAQAIFSRLVDDIESARGSCSATIKDARELLARLGADG